MERENEEGKKVKKIEDVKVWKLKESELILHVLPVEETWGKESHIVVEFEVNVMTMKMSDEREKMM